MPHKSITELPKAVKSLPLPAKKLFLKAYNSAKKKQSEEKAFKIAWTAVKQLYSKKGNKWVRKSSVSVKSVIARTGFFGKRYFFDAVVSSDDIATDGYIADKTMLENLVKNDRLERYGDVDHAKLEGDLRYNKLFKLIKHAYRDGKVYGSFAIDKTHPKYSWFVDKYGQREIKLSCEFYNPRVDGNRIVDCEKLGWTIALDEEPADSNAVAIS